MQRAQFEAERRNIDSVLQGHRALVDEALRTVVIENRKATDELVAKQRALLEVPPRTPPTLASSLRCYYLLPFCRSGTRTTEDGMARSTVPSSSGKFCTGLRTLLRTATPQARPAHAAGTREYAPSGTTPIWVLVAIGMISSWSGPAQRAGGSSSSSEVEP